MQIKNLVLDMGNVLLGWAPGDFALRAAGNAKDAELLNRALFGSPDWALHDAGQLSEEVLFRRASERVPERLLPQLRTLFLDWPSWMPPVPGADEITIRAKAAGYGLYLLSNAGVRFPQAMKTRAFYQRFDGMMVSYHEGMAKPDLRLYQQLCRCYSLIPGECLFVDDMEANVQGARQSGFQAIHFTGDWQPVLGKLRFK